MGIGIAAKGPTVFDQPFFNERKERNRTANENEKHFPTVSIFCRGQQSRCCTEENQVLRIDGRIALRAHDKEADRH